MRRSKLREVLESLLEGLLTVEEAEKQLKLLSILEVEDFARVDVGRELRRGVPEIVLAEGKPPKETLKIVVRLVEEAGRALVARASPSHLASLAKLKSRFKVEIWRDAGLAVVKRPGFRVEKTGGKVAVFTAGTADIPVAREVEVVAGEMGCETFSAYDVGVAGLHRLLKPLREALSWGAHVFVVVAGMEGALPSVVASLVDVPVVGVPTSTGYGYGGRGKAALASMLQTCSLGLAVVNIDNGVGAGVYAALIANQAVQGRGSKQAEEKK